MCLREQRWKIDWKMLTVNEHTDRQTNRETDSRQTISEQTNRQTNKEQDKQTIIDNSLWSYWKLEVVLNVFIRFERQIMIN